MSKEVVDSKLFLFISLVSLFFSGGMFVFHLINERILSLFLFILLLFAYAVFFVISFKEVEE